MKSADYPDDWPDIDVALYHRSVMLFRMVKHLLKVQFELHAESQLLQGDIFLFNHFSRFETFIPQFLIFEKTGAYSCAIASGEFFNEETLLSNYLKQVGVFPHDHPRLFALLAAQILRGRKVIIFPEGGMVKDHRVIDKHGKYSIYSRITGKRRKLHTGPAVLGQGVEILKTAIRLAFQTGNRRQLRHWKTVLGYDSLDELRSVAFKPTLIVPGNITFYPIRSSENLLFKSVEWLTGDMSPRQAEELLIEGNIMLKDTDMDIRLASPVNPCCKWGWVTRYMMNKVALDIVAPDDIFKLTVQPKSWRQYWLKHLFISNAKCSRDQYMKRIYSHVTVNLSHLASALIMLYVSDKKKKIEKNRFYNILYIAIKKLQKNSTIHLHRSLLDPDEYSGLVAGVNRRFDQFVCMARQAELIAEQDECYYFLPQLFADSDFDRIRLENPIAVYNNEVAPVPLVRQTLLDADKDYATIDPQQLTAWHFDDEKLTLAFEEQHYNSPDYSDINDSESQVADPTPFIICPEKANGKGILLIHGLLASPAELRDYGHYLAGQGYTVMGIRLKGHGTSPYALRDVSFEQWLDSVRRGFNILKFHCQTIFIIGFSTGGALGLLLAAENPAELSGVVAVSVPIKFTHASFMLVPLLHNTNKLVRWVSSFEGVKPFIENTPEHPEINYRHIPVRALYELRRLIHELENQLAVIETPVLLLAADQDPIVDSDSAKTIFEHLASPKKQLQFIHADRHGILMENLDDSWRKIDQFLNAVVLPSEEEIS